MNSNNNESSLVVSYLLLRKTIGILGITLPIILYLGGCLLFNTYMQSSISSYYYTGMRDVLVGTLVAFGIFLYSYKGYDNDSVFGKLGCVFAIGIALFPTKPELDTIKLTEAAKCIHYLHAFFTVAFFSTLAYFSCFLFTKSKHEKDKLPPPKKHRNSVYIVCGIIMALCMIGIIIKTILPLHTEFLGRNLIFGLETFAIWAFGVSWFVKGEAIALLND